MIPIFNFEANDVETLQELITVNFVMLQIGLRLISEIILLFSVSMLKSSLNL